jgi:hypothetical protein
MSGIPKISELYLMCKCKWQSYKKKLLNKMLQKK